MKLSFHQHIALFWMIGAPGVFAPVIENAKRPDAGAVMAWGVAIVALNYMLPLLVVSGVLEPGAELANFTVGGFPEVAEIVGGVWLKWMVLGASWLGCCALFFTEISEDSVCRHGRPTRLRIHPCGSCRRPTGSRLLATCLRGMQCKMLRF